MAVAIGAGATFVARTVDTDLANLGAILKQAAMHRGTAFVEVLQNCNMFADGTYEALTDMATRDDSRIVLEHGKPMIFGKQRDKGIRLKGLRPEVVTLGADGANEADLLVHDEASPDASPGFLLSQRQAPEFPLPLGIFRNVSLPGYEELCADQSASVIADKGRGRLESLLQGGASWTVSAEH